MKPYTIRITVNAEDVFYQTVKARTVREALEAASADALERDGRLEYLEKKTRC